MNSLEETDVETVNKIISLKEKGNSLTYKGIDLYDLFFQEIATVLRTKYSQCPLSNFNKIKYKTKQILESDSFKNINLLNEKVIIVFITALNHWQNSRKVARHLSIHGYKPIFFTTKHSLVKIVRSDGFCAINLKGFNFVLRDWSLKKHKTKEQVTEVVCNLLPSVRHLHKKIVQAINQLKPLYVLIGNDNTYEGRLVGVIARMNNIPTGSIQHGSLNRVNPIHGRSKVDQFFVYGERTAIELKYLGLPPERIIVSGWPQKYLLEKELAKSGKITNWKSGFIVITLSGPGHSTKFAHHQKIIDTLILAQKERRLNYCIKLHPKDRKENYSGFERTQTIIVSNDDLAKMGITYFGLLKQAMLVITGASTSALDAMLVRTPVLTIDLFNEFNNVDFIKDGLTYHARTYRELLTHINKLKSPNKNEVKFKEIWIDKYFYKIYDDDFDSAKYIADCILRRIKP